MYTVSPKHGECFFLRLLLQHVVGPTSFEDPRRVDDETCETFREACSRRALLVDDIHWSHCLDEAGQLKKPLAMRTLFAIIMVHGDPLDPAKLWLDYKDALSQDILHRTRQEENDISLPTTTAIPDTALL